MFKSKKVLFSSFDHIFRILITAIILLGLLPIPALAQADGTISGQVTDSSSNSTISGAMILVFESGAQSPTWNGNTDASGNYSLPIPAGTDYRVSALKEGYVTGQAGGKSVTANTTTTVNFSLVPGGIIQGTITDNSSSPIQGADVRAYKPETPGTVFTSLPTDSSGHYSLTTPPGAGYTVEVDKQGYVSANQTGVSAVLGSPTTVDFTLLPPPPPQDSTPPAAVANLAAGSPTSNSITLTWTAPGDDGSTGQASQYQIRYADSIIDDNAKFDNATQAQNEPAPHAAGTSESFNVTGLSANTTYYFALKTRDDANLWSELSNCVSANTTASAPPSDTTPPAAVANLAAGSPTSNSITLTWTAPGDDGSTGQASQYDIRYASSIIDDESKWDTATQVPSPPSPRPGGQSENFTVGNLNPNTAHFFALKAADEVPNWSGLSNSPSANTTAPPPAANFNIAHSGGMSSFMLGAGENITETFIISSVNNFEGTVNLNFNGPPEIQASSSLSPTQVTLAAGETVSVTLTLGASAMTPSGTYQCGIGGQTSAYGGQQKGFFFTVIIGVAGQPLLSASPAVVAAGSQTTFSASQFTASENVTLKWDSGPKVGQTLATGQISGNGTWSTQVTIPADMPGGNFAVKALSASSATIFQLTVTSGEGADFLMSASPQFVSISPGNSANVTVYVTSVNGFNAAVALSAGSPPGVTSSLSTSSVTPSAGGTTSATLTITIADWASPNMYHINVEGACTDPSTTKMVDINLDIQPPAQWGPGISLSQSYGQSGDSITVTGANFPPSSQGQTVAIKEAVSGTTLQTSPATITVNGGSFTGTFTIPSGIPSGNYRIKAIVTSTGDFAERDFQILGTGETFTLGASPQAVTVTTETGQNSASVSVNIVSVGGSSPSVNLDIEGAPSWLQYQFGSLSPNTAASGGNAVSVPAGGSSSRNLSLTASMTAPTGTYSITVKGWKTGNPEQRVSLELTVQPPAGFGMAQLTLSPTFGENGRTVNFSGSGFTDCSPSQVTELYFGQLDIRTGQSLPTITVPTSGTSAGKFSGTFRVPSVLPPGTYQVKLRVGSVPNDKFVSKSFTITGGSDSFVLQASPSFLWAEQGSQINTMIKVQAVGSSSPTVTLSLEGYPADITAGFTSGNVTAPPGGVAGTDLNLSLNDWIPAGHYTITIKGQLAGGAEVHRIPLEMDVVPPAGFGMASVYINPTVGAPGTWITISGSGFPADTPMSHLYFGPPNSENDQVSNLPNITADSSGALSAVFQVPASLTAGMYPIEVVVGNPPDDRRAMSEFTLVSDQASFNINLSPTMIQAAPGDTVSTSVNIQAFGSSSANVTLQVEGPPAIQWRFDGGSWQATKTVSPAIGSAVMSNLEIMPKPSTPMGHYSLAVKASAGEQQEIRNLELDVGASAAYGMSIFSLSPNNGTAGTTVSFSGSNFPAGTQVSGINFGSANITLSQAITTSPQGSFSGAFTVPGTVGGQPTSTGTYMVRATVGQAQAEAAFNVYGSDDTFTLSLSPNFLQGEPGGTPVTSGILKALGGASPTVKMAVKGLPPGVTTRWNGNAQSVFALSAPPGGQNNFELMLVLPGMIPMGQYPATLEGWVDSNQNNIWDSGEKIVRANLGLSIMPPQGYGMGMLSLNPTFGRVGDTITFAGSGFPADTSVQSLTFANTNILTNAITTSTDGSFSGVFTVPGTAFGNNTGPGMYPVDVMVGTPPNDRNGHFEFQVNSLNQKFSVSASPGWLARPAGDTASVSISVRSLVATPPSPTVIIRIEGLPRGVTPSFTSANITPPFGNMESRELSLTISNGCPMGNYPVSIRAYNAAAPAEVMVTNFTLEVTPSSGFMDMGMAMVTISPTSGAVGDQITVSGYGFPKSQNLTAIRLGPTDVTPTVATTTDETGAFSAVITVPALSSGTHPVEVNIQNTTRKTPFDIMSSNDTFSLKISPMWLEPIPAGDPNGRQIAVTVDALTGKTPTVSLSTEGLFTAFGSITEVWDPISKSVSVTSAGGAATAMLTLKPSENTPPGPYPFTIIGVDGQGNRRDYHMEFMVGPPMGFMGGMMGMNQNDWSQQWQGTEWENGIFFPEVLLSPKSGTAGTQVTYTGTNLPDSASITSITFAGNSVPLPTGGLTADSAGGISGSFIVDEAWGLTPVGMYMVDFNMEKDAWSQVIGKDFRIMRSNAAFSLEATPNWIPPIPPGSFGQTKVTAKAIGYTSSNVTLAVMETFGGMSIPGGAQAHWDTTNGPSATNVIVPASSQTSKTFYLQGGTPGHYTITIVGWIDSNSNQVLEPDIQSEAESVFSVPLDFDVEPPQEFKNWDKNAMMSQMGMATTDIYLFYFPEIILNPNVGQAGTTVTIKATDFPANATVTRLRFAGMELPVPTGTAADSNGDFTLVLNVPKTMWGGNIASGWYDVEVEAQKVGEPPVHIMKPFQVTASDVAFTLRADPDWLPPIPPTGSGSTLIRVTSIGVSANVTMSVDKIPPGVTTAFSSSQISVSPGGSGSATLTLTPNNIPPGHYGAEIKGTAIVSGTQKTFYTHLEFEVQPPVAFMNWDKNAMMNQMGMSNTDIYLFYFPEIVLNPNMGQAGNKVTISATNFPAGANVTRLRFAGMELPLPAGTAANSNGDFTLAFNVPKTMWGSDITSGWYDVEVEAQKVGEPPVFIMKPFQVTASDVAFTLRADPNWLPPIPPAGSTTTIMINSMGSGVTVNLSVDKIPPGITTAFSSSQVNVAPGGSGSATLTLTPTSIPPGHYGAEIKGTATLGSTPKTFYTHIEFDVQPPVAFMNWDKNAMMNQMGMSNTDIYLFYFPEITLNPNVGQAGNKVTISATDFPAGANVTKLRFAGKDLPVPSGTAADSNGDFTLVFNVPKTMWGSDITSGWYDVEVEAQKVGEPPVFIMKPFQVTASDVAFTLRADPDWLPPIPPAGSTTTIMINSMGSGVTVNLSVDKIPPGITTAFSSSQVNVAPGGSGSATLTLTPTSIPPGHYGAEIKGTATVGSTQKTFFSHLEFDVQPPTQFMNVDWMAQQGIWFPEITLNPNAGPAKTKVSVQATDFPSGAVVTKLRFAGRELPVPANSTADSNGGLNLVFNVPGDFGLGQYMVEVEAQKTGMPPVFIAKPFFIEDSGVSFKLNVVPGFIPGVPQGASGNTTIYVEATGQAVTVNLYIDGLPPGVTGTFDSNSLSVSPGGSGSTKLNIATRVSTPPGHYPLTIRGVSGSEKRVVPFGLGVTPPAIFQMPEFSLEPDYAPAGYTDKKYKVTFSGTGFPANQSVTSLKFGSQSVAIPDNLTTRRQRQFQRRLPDAHRA